MTTTHIPFNPKQYSSSAGPQQPKTIHYDPNQYAQPIGPKPQSTAAKVAGAVTSAAKSAAGLFRDVGENPHIQRIAGQSGFGGSQQAPSRRSRTQPAQDPGAPGETIYITRCDASGNCKQTKLRGGTSRQPRRRAPGWATGTLGGEDPGFL